MPKKQRYNYVDIFAGCGGASLGLHNAGWHGLFAIEKSKMAFGTLKANLIDNKKHFQWPKWLPEKEHNIETFLKRHRGSLSKLKGHVDLLVGGPPCQGFSFAGRRHETDKRNKLANSYIRFVDIVRPKILFFENVKGFTVKFHKNNSSGRVYSDYVLKRLAKIGYDVHAEIVNFGEFGIPQERKRFILVGVQKGLAKDFFTSLSRKKTAFLSGKGLSPKVTVADAISDLKKQHGTVASQAFPGFVEGLYGEPESAYQRLLRDSQRGIIPDSHRFSNHGPKTLEKFNYVLEKCAKGKNIVRVLRKAFELNKHSIVPLADDRRSPTLTTLPDDYIHYEEPRILSVREYARIQSFNDWYEIRGAYTTGGKLRRKAVPRYSQIGNAIPPLFMEQVGAVLKEML